jgi:hypothetical protein
VCKLLYRFEHCLENVFEGKFLNFLFIICANVPYFEVTLPIEWYEACIQNNREKVEDVEIRALIIYEDFLKRKQEFTLTENVEKRRLEQEERNIKEAEMNERLRPRIEYDLMRQSGNGIIFPDIQ